MESENGFTEIDVLPMDGFEDLLVEASSSNEDVAQDCAQSVSIEGNNDDTVLYKLLVQMNEKQDILLAELEKLSLKISAIEQAQILRERDLNDVIKKQSKKIMELQVMVESVCEATCAGKSSRRSFEAFEKIISKEALDAFEERLNDENHFESVATWLSDINTRGDLNNRLHDFSGLLQLCKSNIPCQLV